MPSVLQDWVMELGWREQGTLLTGLRGCDLAPKYPLDSIERQLTAHLRYVVMNPFDAREIDSAKGCFMISTLPESSSWKPSSLEHYPLHWYAHLMHAYEVVAYRHPSHIERVGSFEVFRKLTKALHLTVESIGEMTARLGEDRMKTGEIVS